MKHLSQKQKLFALMTVALALVALPDLASAGADATFNAALTQISGWLSGSLGKLISVALVAVGIIAGIARQSLMGFAVGIGAGLGLANASTIIDGLFTATLPVVS